jgi:uncharacterized SAM-binding protein YcdF (DUF218 family)
MYFLIKATLRTLVLPPAGPLILAIAGAWLLRRRPRLGGFLLAFGLASLWLLSLPIVADAVTRLAERCPPLDLSKPTGAQAIVILAGGGQRMFAPEFQGPEADYQLLERLSYGAYVARTTGVPVLVSGTPNETTAMRVTLARDFGVSTRWIEGESRDTYENARFSAVLLRTTGIKRIILITSSTHLYRAAQEYREAGFDVVPAPAGVWAPREDRVFRWLPQPDPLLRSHLALYELIGEPMRRLQAALGVRERFDRKAAGGTVN